MSRREIREQFDRLSSLRPFEESTLGSQKLLVSQLGGVSLFENLSELEHPSVSGSLTWLRERSSYQVDPRSNDRKNDDSQNPHGLPPSTKIEPPDHIDDGVYEATEVVDTESCGP